MYFKEYSSIKGNILLQDKFISSFYDKKYSYFKYIDIKTILFSIQLNIKNYKRINILIYFTLRFLGNSSLDYIAQQQNKYIILFWNKLNIFKFLQNLILIYLPLLLKNDLFFLDKTENLKFLKYSFKELPLFLEHELIIELNDFYINAFKKIEMNLFITSTFLSILHKESFARFLKLPIILY